MMSDPREVLSALADGEAVDADAVAAALETAANRAALVDFVRLRASVRNDEEIPPRFDVDAVLARELRSSRPTRAWLRAAAVLALLTAGALGGTWVHDFAMRERPPEPSRVVQLEPVQSR